jgi:small-conductance mechanosensitive channel
MQITADHLSDELASVDARCRDLRAERDVLAEQRAAMDARDGEIAEQLACLTGHAQRLQALIEMTNAPEAQEAAKEAPATQEPGA